ncbi:LuxR C-terminal-related transcriptional regulator [Kaarinaea lacus]
MHNISVMIVSDNEMLREGLRLLLEKQEDLHVTAISERSKTVLTDKAGLHPDVLVLITSLSESSGIESLTNFREIFHDAKIVLLTNDNEGNYVHKALNYGASGYVIQSTSSSEVEQAIRTVNRDQYYLSPSIQDLVVKTFMEGTRRKPRGNNPDGHLYRGFNLLTSREKQVFQLLVEGHSSAQIGKELGISSKTIDKHRANIYKKVGVDNPVQMLQYAYRIGVTSSSGLAQNP